MNTINGSLDVEPVGDQVRIVVRDCDTMGIATAELSMDHVASLWRQLGDYLTRR